MIDDVPEIVRKSQLPGSIFIALDQQFCTFYNHVMHYDGKL